MRIILSRKGFDSANGGVPSPILPSGDLLSLPIPETRLSKQFFRYSDLRYGGQSLDEIVAKLTRNRVSLEFAHPDPDLRETSMERVAHWRPAVGQAEAAEAHLRRQGVGPGDLFLFFGWFRKVDATWRYLPNSPDLHVLFGWLQIDHKISVHDCRPSEDLQRHPHFVGPPYGRDDAVYTATRTLSIPGLSMRLPGAGAFRSIHPDLILTRADHTRSAWRLPAAFATHDGRVRLSYHQRRTAERGGDWIFFKSVGRGQEFVVSCELADPILAWVCKLFNATA